MRQTSSSVAVNSELHGTEQVYDACWNNDFLNSETWRITVSIGHTKEMPPGGRGTWVTIAK